VKKQSLDLKNYILHLDNWIPQNILDDSLKELKKNKTWQRHFYTSTQNYNEFDKNGERELDVCYGDDLTYIEELMRLTWKALEKYIVIDKISGPQFDGWKGFYKLRFNRYNKNQIMSKHCDHIHSLFTGEKRGIPILSIVGVLNDDYEGGEMYIDTEKDYWKQDPQQLVKLQKAGSISVFPSDRWHKVAKVTKGIRYSLVVWLMGDPWK